jgi:putative nucleotidyltransferase with HDIG domain
MNLKQPLIRNLEQEVFGFLETHKRARIIDTTMKNFWAGHLKLKGYENKHQMHLAHGYNHAIRVANNALVMAKKIGNVNLENIYVAGLLHDIYRPIKGEDGAKEEHGTICSEIARKILENAKVFKDEEIDLITDGILHHDLSWLRAKEREKKLQTSNFHRILFLADKSHINIERVMAYAYDLTCGCNEQVIEQKWKEQRDAGMTLQAILLSFYMTRYGSATELLQKLFGLSAYGKSIRSTLAAYKNTYHEVESQVEKCDRDEDRIKTIIQFWAFKEAISNLRYICTSERFLTRKYMNLFTI